MDTLLPRSLPETRKHLLQQIAVCGQCWEMVSGRWRGERSDHAGGLRGDEKKLREADTQHRVIWKTPDDQVGWAGKFVKWVGQG